MGMAPERSRPLHNFSLPRFSWGCQRVLKCIKLDADADADARLFDLRSSQSQYESDGYNPITGGNSPIKCKPPSIADDFRNSIVKPIDGGKHWEDNGIDAVRAKLMLDIRLAADKMKDSILEEKHIDSPTPARPWNLRSRRSACKAPNDSGGGGAPKGANLRSEERRSSSFNSSPARGESPMTEAKSSRLRGSAAAAAAAATTSVEKRPRFSISLSREEIASDFTEIAGTKPQRRPKKRSKNVQKNLDTLFPGLWLREVTLEAYKVPDLQ